MAAMASSTQAFTEEESRNEFHRVVALQYECVTDTLRELLDYKLFTSNLTLAEYLKKCRIQLQGKPYVTPQQDNFLMSSDPNTTDMDVTLLTMLLLAKCNNQIGLGKRERECIKKLREHRNTLAHSSTGRLKDNSLFTETSNDILALASYLKADSQNNIKACIDELKQRVCVRMHSKLDVITFNQEHLRMILIQEEENAVHVEDCSEALLKFNITKWTKQISRVLDMSKMLQDLRGKNILPKDVLDRVNEVEYECDKAPFFLEYLVKEGSKKQILQFCKALRSQSRAEYGQHIANLIEGRDTGGIETVQEIKKIEENEIREVLREHIEKVDTGSQICEDLHIFVEEVLCYDVEFSTLHQIVTEVFDTKEDNGRYEGILIKRSGELTEASLDDDDNVAAMTFQNYAEYVGKQFWCIDEFISSRITTAIVKEAIQMETFVDMNKNELKQIFSHYLEPQNYRFGIEKQLQRLQNQIRQQLKANTTNSHCTLRQFDQPYHGKYHKCEVSYRSGDEPGIAEHDFCQPPFSNLTKHLVIKKSIRFITACLNSRKNGTIHFGISRTGRNKGEILGIDFKDTSLLTSVDEVIEGGITRCFRHLTNNSVRNIIRCCRPAHVIPVQDQDKVVIEIDIVPFHRHLGSSFFSTLFPPNGRQQVTFFVYERNDIVAVEKERIEDVKLELMNAIKERQILDTERLRSHRLASDLVQRLTYELTRGADFITDTFYPILCTGKMESAQCHVLDYEGLKDAFQNAVAVFDFGSSTELRKKMEGGIPMFSVKTAADFDFEETNDAFSEKESPWIYCNGNDDLGIEVMDIDSWTDQRMIPLENVLRHLKRKLPSLHAKVIFLIFEEAYARDPMIEFAREAFIRIFKHQCIIIGETDEVFKAFEYEISSKIRTDKVNSFFFSGLNWFHICKVFSKVFKEESDEVCKLPNSLGTYEELPQNEKGKWKDIEILSMEECVKEEKLMTREEQKAKSKEEETKFYRGKAASWWNFYHSHHGERDLFSKLRGVIEKKLTREDGKVLVESVDIHHEPGAGGSILGRHLIWHFSQVRCIDKPYRCCVVKQITENTVEEIDKFRQYRDRRPRPVIVLLDDEPDGNMFFQKGLYQLAYKTASPGELFGVVINISRVSLANDSVEKAENGKIAVKNILKHRLSDRERQWFERKYKELEDADVDVNTLIAFNVMRNSFDKKYIKSTVETILESVQPNDIDVLKILSLFGTYEIGICLPSSIFDRLSFSIPFPVISESKPEKIGEGKPYGMRPRKKINFSRPPEILNSHCLSLFACRVGYEKRNRGLRILSQPLAEVVLRYIRDKENVSLEDVVAFVLQHMKNHSSQENVESKRFVELVCALFKTRGDTGRGKDGVKDKFSRLILAFIDKENVNSLDEGRDSIVRIMEECFSISEDAFVAQQLARFLIIHKKDFKAGEQAIYTSITLCQNNSYLLDTYGQVFKTQMEYIKDSNSQRGNKMTTETACEVISLAFKAIDKFTEGQNTTQEFEKDKINLSCYHMEVRTLVGLLETFESFECFTNYEDMVEVLTNQKDIRVSFLSVLNETGSIQEIIYGGARQRHACDALRYVEELDYQVKKVCTVYTGEEVLLLSLRERYERFYRTHGLKYQLKFGYGLKQLMRAYDTNDTKELVEQRLNDAERNLQHLERLGSFEGAEVTDLLFHLGYKFLALLRADCTLHANLYRQLLKYSSKLLATQRKEGVQRPYIEAYLFFAVFHWPRRNRLAFSSLSPANTYTLMMKEWEQAYKGNYNITTDHQMKNYKGKNYFALSKDSFGLIDLYEIDLEWKQQKEREEGRSRMHVYKDYFWRDPYVADRIKRLSGTLNDTGTIIEHIVHYPNGDHPFKIRTFYPSDQLRNRRVTFVLGFTWSGLRAFDVIEESDEFPSSGEEDSIPDEPKETVKPRDVDPRLYQCSDNKSAVEIIMNDGKTKELYPRSTTTPHVSQPYVQYECGRTVQKEVQAQVEEIAESPPIQIDKNENASCFDQDKGVRPKSAPRSLQGPSLSFVPTQRNTSTRQTVEPPSITSLEVFPPLGNEIIKNYGKSKELYPRSKTTPHASQLYAKDECGRTVQKEVKAQIEEIAESPPIQMDKNENTSYQGKGVRPKSAPRSLQGPSFSFVTQKRYTSTRQTVKPSNITSFQVNPPCENDSDRSSSESSVARYKPPHRRKAGETGLLPPGTTYQSTKPVWMASENAGQVKQHEERTKNPYVSSMTLQELQQDRK